MGQCGRDYFIDEETEALWRLNNLAKFTQLVSSRAKI